MMDFKAMEREREERAALTYPNPHIIYGDIWTLKNQYDYVVVTTNIGWKKNPRSNPTGVMGRGIALQAAQRYPGFQDAWGRHCCEYREGAEVSCWDIRWPLIAFPTKPHNPKAPHLSWQNSSTMELLHKSMSELLTLIPMLDPGRILLPPIGCGNGGLHRPTVEREVIFPAMQREPRLYYVQPG